MKKESYSRIFLLLAVIFITAILTSNILASKMILVFGVSMTGGVLVFPITYILGDVFTEVYGFEKSKRVILYGFLCNLIMVILFFIGMKMPYPDFWTNQDAFRTILSTIVGELLDTSIFILVGFLGTMPFTTLLTMILFQSLAKIIYEVVLTPVTYKVISYIKSREKLS